MEFRPHNKAVPQGRYARMAHSHLKEHLPVLYQQLKESNKLIATVNEMGRQTIAAIETRVQELKKANPIQTAPGTDPTFLQQAQLESWARSMAEEEILPRLIYLAPETPPQEMAG